MTILRIFDALVLGTLLGNKTESQASIWNLLMMKCLALYFEMYMESNLGLMLENT